MKWIELNNELKVMKDGKYQFEKDKEAVKSYFIDYVNQNTVFFHDLKEKLDYLVENEYYNEEVLNKYTFEQIKNVFKLIYNKKFRFPSFMSAYKFYNNYALKTNDGKKFLERYEDRVAANALELADGNYELALKMADVMICQEYQPSTPSHLNAMRKRSGRGVSCFLIDMPDSTEGIMYAVESAAQLSRSGGGVGISLSKIRANGETIKGIENASSGVVGIAKLLEDTFSYFNQLGQRNGAGVAYLNIFHADIEQFLETKKINADEKVRLKTLSIGVTIPSKFFELAEKNEPYFVFYPHTVFKKYGTYLDEMNMDEWYDKLVNDKDVRKCKLDARKMLTKIAQIQQESGYPYVIYISNANEQNTLRDVGIIKMSNLCVEVFQIQENSIINSYKGENVFGKDISCNLGSLNIVNVMENKRVEETVEISIRALNTVAKNTSIDEVPTVKNANDAFHSVGLGAMNMHGYLAKNKIMYGSKESKDFANVFFAMVRYYAIKASMKISQETGFIFEGFEKSEYAKGTSSELFKKYVENEYSPKTERVKSLFEGIHIPTKEEWGTLLNQVKENGIANSYLLAIAPTQSISYIQNSTSSVMPITEQIETRTYGDSTTHYAMPYMTNENFFYYQPAYEMNMFKVIDLISIIQEHIDQGISTTLYVTSDATTRDIARYYIYAHKKNLKSLYYTRTKLLSVNDCVACSV